MLLSVHAAAGALIGQQTNNPLLAFIFAFLSHFVLDMIPHGDHDWIHDYKGTEKKRAKKIISIVVIDASILLALLISHFFYKPLAPNLSIAAGILGGLLPDFLIVCHELSDKLFKNFYRFHFVIHNLIKIKPTVAQGIVFQAVILGILLLKI